MHLQNNKFVLQQLFPNSMDEPHHADSPTINTTNLLHLLPNEDFSNLY